MNYFINYCFLLLLLICNATFAATLDNKSLYWQCSSYDQHNKQWSVQNSYQKMALNLAFAACKKESTVPASCNASESACEGFNQNLSTKSLWQCTALDETAAAWLSNFYLQREDAALGAKAYCQEKSAVPDTCYIDMVTCMNINGD